MDRKNLELQEFLEGIRRAIKIEVIITQDISPINNYRDTEITTVEGYFLYQLWADGKFVKREGKPKRQAQSSYTKLYDKKLDEFVKKGLTPELYGYMRWLSKNIQWDNGLLINRRSKKPLKLLDIAGIWKRGKTKASEIIKELKDNNLLIHDKEGYKVNTQFIERGGK